MTLSRKKISGKPWARKAILKKQISETIKRLWKKQKNNRKNLNQKIAKKSIRRTKNV